MKTRLMFLTVVLIPVLAQASYIGPSRQMGLKEPAIPARHATNYQTSTIEWGCPVMDVVQASSDQEAIRKVQEQCIEATRSEIKNKPGILDIINISVVFPDIDSTPQNGGYLLKGTFFLETLVLKSPLNN